jgi:hypothetical protein
MSRTGCTRTHRWCAGRESTPEETQLHTIVWGYCDDNKPPLSHPRALYHPQHHHDQSCPAQPALTLFPAFIQSSQPDNTFYNLKSGSISDNFKLQRRSSSRAFSPLVQTHPTTYISSPRHSLSSSILSMRWLCGS